MTLKELFEAHIHLKRAEIHIKRKTVKVIENLRFESKGGKFRQFKTRKRKEKIDYVNCK